MLIKTIQLEINTTHILEVKSIIFIALFFSLISCKGQNNKSQNDQDSNSSIVQSNKQLTQGSRSLSKFDNQISNVVRTVYQDSKGVFWFGGEGTALRLNGDTLSHMANIRSEDGKGITVKDITEDKNGKIWFGHTDGISVYDGASVKNYYESNGLISNDVWCIMTDKNNQVWIGTIDGVCIFNGKEFTTFEIPEGKKDPRRGVSSKKIVHHIMEDSKGRIWFSTNGGVYIKEDDLLTNISEKDGLKSNFVNKVLEDKDGSFWICTSDGLYHYANEVLNNITEEIIVEGKGIGTIIQDFKGNIWFNSNLRDIYYFDGAHFTKYRISKDEYGPAPFHIYEDQQCRLWFTGYGGAYRFENDKFVNIKEDGPW